MKSIADFAADLILDEVKDIEEGKIAPPSMSTNTPQQAPAGKDIRNVKVPASFMQEILGEEFVPSSEEEELVDVEETLVEETHAEEPEETSSPLISENKVDELVVLLKEVKVLLSEMTMATTTTGQIGVNLAGPGKRSTFKPKRGYALSTKATLPSNFKSAKAVLKDAIKRRRSK